MIAAGVSALAGSAPRADSSLDFRYLFYGENDNRTQVLNPELYFQQNWGEKGQLGLLLSYDSISGASPTGAVPTVDATASASSVGGTIPMADYTDTREAVGLSFSRRFGSQIPSVSLSYSKEGDYLSRGVSLVDSWEMLGKRSTLHFGFGRTWDDIFPANMTQTFTKSSQSYSLGWTQVLGPQDLLDVSFGLDKLSGYLTDPYKVVTVGGVDMPEVRPEARSRKTAVIKYGHYFHSRTGFKPSFRYYWDDWSIKAYTLGLEVDQRVGKRLILSPELRFYRQGAASFFAYEFAAPQPTMSADYRLSSFWSWKVGLGLTVPLSDRVSFNTAVAYQDQTGLDRFTPAAPIVAPLRTGPSTVRLEEDDGGEGGEGGPTSLSAADMTVLNVTFGFTFSF
jgi:uncharacterized protein DUF3570